MPALRIYAGPAARRQIELQGLRPQDIGVVPGAAGGPKGLVLGPLDRFIFGHWLVRSDQPVHLVGASIGAWRLATACLDDSLAAFDRLERDYIAQDFPAEAGRSRPTATRVSALFGQSLQAFYGGRVEQVLHHARYRLHIITARGRHVLRREHRIRTPLGYLGAFVANALHRRALGGWLERVVFSVGAADAGAVPEALPFAAVDYPTRQVPLTAANFFPALQASCSIPFALNAVHDIPGAPRGAYWDGGLTDYHLHLDYRAAPAGQLVLYPHFQKAVVPGWLDKRYRWRHGATPFLDPVVVLAPDPDWVRALPGGKLPDRADFLRFRGDVPARSRLWNAAVGASQQLADEFAQWLEHPDPRRIEPL